MKYFQQDTQTPNPAMAFDTNCFVLFDPKFVGLRQILKHTHKLVS